MNEYQKSIQEIRSKRKKRFLRRGFDIESKYVFFFNLKPSISHRLVEMSAPVPRKRDDGTSDYKTHQLPEWRTQEPISLVFECSKSVTIRQRYKNEPQINFKGRFASRGLNEDLSIITTETAFC